MPQLFSNSSSALSQTEQDEYLNRIPPVDSKKPQELQHESTADKEQEFHYGTQELLDALPRVWTRSLLYVAVGFAAIVLPWSTLSKIDETGSARGRIEPKGATQKLDSPALGTVIAVNVKEGEIVKAGQTLLEIESDVLKTELQQAQLKLEGLQNRYANLETLKNQLVLSLNTQQQQNKAQELAKLSEVEQERQNFDALKTAYNLQKEEKLAKVNQIKQALESSKAAYKVAEVRFQASQEKVPRYKKAYEDGAISQDRFKEVEQSKKEDYERLVQARTEISQAQSSLQEQQSSYERTLLQAKSDIQQAQLRVQEEQGSYQSLIHTGRLAKLKTEEQLKEQQSQINAIQSEIAQTKSQITSLKIQLQQRRVRAPIDGVIFELPVTKPGAVLQPGQRVAQIAPKNSSVVLKAQMPMEHTGFLKMGMPVKIKLDAYPFQDYGVVQGRVNWISPDSRVQQTSLGDVNTFELEITIPQPYIQSGRKRIPLTAGQTATAEVIIRQRRVIDYVLDPFKKLQKDGAAF
ncbi:HlyD family efflux transporter periplasmic adaptor subunit [Scytonema sp. NUACC26]|uniref:HlyD family efflux transporter periplasmic adaptor subunit n=1 Tax=Scytonema sp. NUACC26 TaxID=3140176 RepID=UPI0034DCA598